MEIVLSAAAAVLVYVLGDLLFLKCKPLREKIFTEGFDSGIFLVRSGITGLINLVLIAACSLFVVLFTTVSTPVSVIAGTVVSVLCYLAFVVGVFLPKRSASSFLKGCALLCTIPFLLEIFVFNGKSIDFNKAQFIPAAADYEIQTPETVSINYNIIKFTSDGSVAVNVNRSGIKAVQIGFIGDDRIFTCSVAMKDENFSSTYIGIGSKKTSGEYSYCDFNFSPYNRLNSFKISLEGVKSEVSIQSVKFLSALPFSFSLLRFFFLSAAGIIIFSISFFKLYKVIYDRRKKLHKAVIFGALALCLISMFMFFYPGKPIEYPVNNISGSDHYVQMFDALYKGQTNLDIEADPRLAALENPYDQSLRSANKVNVVWDRAYYNGQYYSYFGIVPVLIFYFPFYLICGMLPTMNMTAFFFSALSIIFLFGTIMTAVKMFVAKPNMLVLVLGLITSVFISGIYYCLDFSNIYFTAVVSAMCFLLLCLWTGLSAYNRKSAKVQLVLLAVSGLSFILCVGCRPTMALAALILAPALISILLNNEYKTKRKIYCVCSFFAPIIIGVAALLWYNYIRFDSFLEFGTTYQLTVNDIRANTVSLSDLPSAVIQYLLQPMGFTAHFPHIELTRLGLSNYGHYVYCEKQLGLISFPSIVTALFLFPFVIKRKSKNAGRLGSNSVKFYTYLLIIILSLVIIWLDFCMAGTAFRYLLDILPILTILSILVFLEFNTKTASMPAVQHKGTLMLSISMVLTTVIIFLQMLTFTTQSLFKRAPDILFIVEDLVEFWC